MYAFFGEFAGFVVFIHLLSAIIWIGGMIAVRVAVHPVIARGGLTQAWMKRGDMVASMLTPKQRLGITLQITGRLFNLVMLFVFFLLLTGMIMALAMHGHEGDLKALFVTKEIIWTLMTLNYLYMYAARKQAFALFDKGEIEAAKAKVALIPNLLLPVNIFLGLVALFVGVVLRGY